MAFNHSSSCDNFEKCQARMHGLIHDDRLWACQSCLLGLMYVLRVNVHS
jgi:hypothetical protein